MRTKIVPLLGLLLSISTVLNIYLYFDKAKWEQSWLNQFIATSEVENILKQAASDTTLENIKNIAIGQFGSENVHVVDLQGKFQE